MEARARGGIFSVVVTTVVVGQVWPSDSAKEGGPFLGCDALGTKWKRKSIEGILMTQYS